MNTSIVHNMLEIPFLYIQLKHVSCKSLYIDDFRIGIYTYIIKHITLSPAGEPKTVAGLSVFKAAQWNFSFCADLGGPCGQRR